MKKTILLNAPEGCSKTIMAQYWKTSIANLLRFGGGHRATGIMEIYDDSSEDTAGDEKGIH